MILHSSWEGMGREGTNAVAKREDEKYVDLDQKSFLLILELLKDFSKHILMMRKQ